MFTLPTDPRQERSGDSHQDLQSRSFLRIGQLATRLPLPLMILAVLLIFPLMIQLQSLAKHTK